MLENVNVIGKLAKIVGCKSRIAGFGPQWYIQIHNTIL